MYLLKVILLIFCVSEGCSELTELQLDGLERTRTSSVKLTAYLLREFICQNPGKNTVLTGLVANYGLGAFAAYAKHKSDSERLVKILNYKSLHQIKCIIPILTKLFQTYVNTISIWSAFIYGDVGRKFTRKFSDELYKTFDGFVKNVNFKDSRLAADSISRLADINTIGISTNGDLIKSEMIKGDDGIFYIVGNYFEGGFTGDSNPCNTRNRDFRLPSGEITQKTTMLVRGEYRYGKMKKYDAELLELPFYGNDFTMRIAIPKKDNDMLAIIDELGDPELFEETFSSLNYRNLNCYLPKIEIHKNYNFLENYEKSKSTTFYLDGIINLTGRYKFINESNIMENDHHRRPHKDLKSIELAGIFTDPRKARVLQILVDFHLKLNEGMTHFNNTDSRAMNKDPLTVFVNASFVFYICDSKGTPMLPGIFTGVD